jgi:hypothetical protein
MRVVWSGGGRTLVRSVGVLDGTFGDGRMVASLSKGP